MKNPFKNKKVPNPQAPRSFEDIKKEYSDLLGKVATAQYVAYVNSLEVQNLNKRLVEVNQEANARQALDKQVAEAAKGAKNEKP